LHNGCRCIVIILIWKEKKWIILVTLQNQ
jgi:hypothetical protein